MTGFMTMRVMIRWSAPKTGKRSNIFEIFPLKSESE